jgi:hypothetical protein
MVVSMKKLCLPVFSILIILSLGFTQVVSAQAYSFTISQYEVEAYINADGTLTLYYYMAFDNMANADPIDFIDVGLPSQDYDLNSITATVDDKEITGIGPSAYVDGIELPLGANAIQSGQSGVVIATIGTVKNILYPYDQADRENYVNFQFSPNWIDSQYEKSTATKYRVTIILPPGVGTDEGVYYIPDQWPGSDTPEASLTEDGRVFYSWYTENANVHTEYFFGSAFPAQYVESSGIVTKIEEPIDSGTGGSTGGGFFSQIGSLAGPCGCVIGIGAIIAFIIYQTTTGARKRKLQYLPPKIAIEGHGIKRGLTAVEAAVIMEEPMDKILTMIMFSTIKKGAATVLERNPLKLEVTDPLPEGLQTYEAGFLAAFKEPTADARRRALQSVMVDLVKTSSTKMKGFSRKETVEYYKEIIQKAWQMVEEAQTPEVKSEQYDRTMEWTMLDKDYQERTQRTFTGMPVFVPIWWYRYDPVYRQTSQGIPRPTASTTGVPSPAAGSKPSMSLPNIPGSDFAASVINGATGMAAGVVGSVTDFTSGVTTRTNPIPVTTSSSSGSGGFRGGGGGGHSCACACACAGCACACAGGGR